MLVCQTEAQQAAAVTPSTVDNSGLQVIVTQPSPCATPALSPQTPSASAAAPTVGYSSSIQLASFQKPHRLFNLLSSISHIVEELNIFITDSCSISISSIWLRLDTSFVD